MALFFCSPGKLAWGVMALFVCSAGLRCNEYFTVASKLVWLIIRLPTEVEGVSVMVGVSVGVMVGVKVGVMVGVNVGALVGVGEFAGAVGRPPPGVLVGVAGVRFGVLVGVGTSVGVGVFVGVGVSVGKAMVGRIVGVTVGRGVLVGGGSGVLVDVADG
jgi:hypothetical protein